MDSSAPNNSITTILGAIAALAQVLATFAPALDLASLSTPAGLVGAGALGALGFFTNRK